MYDIIRIIKSLENSDALFDGVSERVTHKIKKQKGRFPGMLLGTLAALLSGKMLTPKEVMKAGREYNAMFDVGKNF